MLNDIALLILAESVTISSAINMACLPKSYSKSYPGTNQYVYASGWVRYFFCK